MGYRPPVECPVCHESLVPDRGLEEYLMEDHTKRELIEYVRADFEDIELEDELE